MLWAPRTASSSSARLCWTADGWVGSFYPEGAKPADFSRYYSTQFNCVEIDSTFYRIPTAKTVDQWRERTPKGFVFATKAPPQAISGEKVLTDADDALLSAPPEVSSPQLPVANNLLARRAHQMETHRSARGSSNGKRGTGIRWRATSVGSSSSSPLRRMLSGPVRR